MWRTIERGMEGRDSQAVSPGNLDQPQQSENWPTPGELAIESGAIIAGALFVAFTMEFLLTALGIPNPV